VKTRCLIPMIVLLALLAGFSGPVRAGGPFYVTAEGRPYAWDPSQPVRYVLDAGPLGSHSRAAAVALVEQALRTWEAVPGARLRFEPAGELPQDITGASSLAFLNGLKPGDPSPILFDSDGSITDLLNGQGASQVLAGFAYPRWGDPRTARITASFAVLNAKYLSEYSEGFARQWWIHELGHFLGLGHSQLHADQFYDGDPTNDSLAPAMSYSFGANSTGHLHREDEAWFSWLYPAPDSPAATGSLRGRVLLPDRATGLSGVSVIARRIGDPLVTAVSSLSGFLFGTGDDALQDPGRPGQFDWTGLDPLRGGANDLGRLGEFLIPGLPPGSYTLEIRPVDAIPSPTRRGFLIGGPKFWREGSASQDPSDAATPIEVSAGQETSGIDIVVTGEDRGAPRLRLEEEPNPWSAVQAVGDLPVQIQGAVQGDRGAVSVLLSSEEELADVFQVTLTEWTMVTAVLSTGEPETDLDLYVFGLQDAWRTVARATARGTPPEVLQLRLAAGTYRFGVHHAGGPGSGYTLRLLAAPAPEMGEIQEPPRVNYLVIGDVTGTGALARWQTTGETAAVIHYGQPLREAGSPQRGREHSLSLTGLTPASLVTAIVYTAPGVEGIGAHLTTAQPPAANGTPRIAIETQARLSSSRPLGRDSSVATVILSNTGDGDALEVRIDAVTLAPGWEVLSEALSGTRLPGTFEVGRLGARAQGLVRIRIVRRSGTADPGITVHGSYTDAAGTARRF
jgi:hypothetical protein